jgi:hypothetical protein
MDFDPGESRFELRPFVLCRPVSPHNRTKCAARLGVSAQPLAATAGCVAA